VFECRVNDSQYETLRDRLVKTIDPTLDSIRVYRLPTPREEHLFCYGIDGYTDFEKPLILWILARTYSDGHFPGRFAISVSARVWAILGGYIDLSEDVWNNRIAEGFIKPVDISRFEMTAVASSFRAGWGLEPNTVRTQVLQIIVASSFRAGWGLELMVASTGIAAYLRLHPAFGLDEDWNRHEQAALKFIKLHPAFGLDEDWNVPRDANPLSRNIMLHPAFGLDEDWNPHRAFLCLYWVLIFTLHPAFGLDEDWNCTHNRNKRRGKVVASSFRAGWGLER
jgi:CRISPR associated protein Cas2